MNGSTNHQVKRPVNLYAEVKLEVPSQAPDREIAEALLQEFSAFLAGRPGLRAQFVKIDAGTQTAEYVLTINDEPVPHAIAGDVEPT